MRGTIGLTYEAQQDFVMPMGFYFGPTKYRDLRAEHQGFEKMLPLGWWIFSKFVSRIFIIPTFNFLETFNWNYGIIIIVFTILLRLLLFPLTFKSYQGTAIMRILKPEMDALNKKYPNPEDAMKKSQEMQRLQKKAGYNPMAGCLPILLQMPILTAMFMFYPQSVELRQKHFLWCDDLSTYDSILDLGFNIPLYGDHVSLFCLLMFGMQFFYTWYTMRSNQGQASMPGMKFVMYFMPFMMLFMFNSMAAALTLYYFVSLSLTMLQMILIRKFTNEKKVRARMAAYYQKHGNKPAKKSNFQKRLEQAQKMAEEAQRQQQKRK
jgi:YidC/Oxa1 family membrane protein insertase